MQDDDSQAITSSIPEPQVIRERLGKLVREAALLRGLLKVSERAAKVRSQFPANRESSRESEKEVSNVPA